MLPRAAEPVTTNVVWLVLNRHAQSRFRKRHGTCYGDSLILFIYPLAENVVCSKSEEKIG